MSKTTIVCRFLQEEENVALHWSPLYLSHAPSSPHTDLEVFACLSPLLDNQLLKVTNDKSFIRICLVVLSCIPHQKSPYE